MIVLFQSLIGRLKTGFLPKDEIEEFIKFQSLIGRLKTNLWLS